MAVEPGHIQISEFSRDVIPSINWMMEDLFCRYGVSIPYFMLDFDFPDYSQRPDWITYSPPEWYLPEWEAEWPTWMTAQWPDWLPTNGFTFGSDWGEWGYWLPWFNELLGLLFDEADLPRWQMPDLSPSSFTLLNEQIDNLYFYSTAEETFSAIWNDGEILLASMGRSPYGLSYAAAKTAYQVMEDAGTVNIYSAGVAPSQPDRDGAIWGAYTDGVWYVIWTYQVCFTFNTTNANVGHATATVEIPVDDLIVSGGNPTLYLYKTSRYGPGEYNWSEGSKVAEHECDGTEEGTTIEMVIDVSDDVNVGGYSHYRLAIKDMVDVTYIAEPLVEGRANMKQQSVMPDWSNVKLVLT